MLPSQVSFNAIKLMVKADDHSSQTPQGGPAGGWQDSEACYTLQLAHLCALFFV